VTIIAAWFAANGLFLLWILMVHKMINNVNTVRGFVAYCVRLIEFVEREDGEFFEPKHGVRTELLIPYGLFVANTDEQMFNTVNMIFDMAVVEFPSEQGWNISILSSDEAMYMNTIKNMKEAIS
jgi:hypothetical protein